MGTSLSDNNWYNWGMRIIDTERMGSPVYVIVICKNVTN